MKTLFEMLRFLKIARTKPGALKLTAIVLKFIETAHKEQRPIAQKIGVINMDTGEEVDEFVTLWAGIGNASPIRRCTDLKAQNNELKRLLQLAKGGELTTETKQQIETALNYFD